jgi:hypothetical protein
MTETPAPRRRHRRGVHRRSGGGILGAVDGDGVDGDRLARVATLLRSLRRSLDAYLDLADPSPAEVDRWEIDLYAYDEALVTAADLLDVEVPPEARDDLTPDHRARLERALAGAGLDVRAAGDPGSGAPDPGDSGET